MFKVLRKFLGTILIVVLALFLINCFIQKLQGIHHPKTFGYGFGIIMTGSMEPELEPGDFVIIQEQDAYQEGDIITYDYYTGISVTHRIVDIDGDNIRPQGDRNIVPDPKITVDDIYGKVIFHFPIIYFLLGMMLLGVYLLIDIARHPDD